MNSGFCLTGGYGRGLWYREHITSWAAWEKIAFDS